MNTKSDFDLTTTNSDTLFLLDAYERMLFVRSFEQKVMDLCSEKPPKIAGSVHLCAGQEAIPVGTCSALDKNRDAVICTYRGHGWALAWGLEPQAIYDEILHRKTGLNGGRAGSAFMMAPDKGFIGENSIVAAGTPIADGIALAQQYRENDGVVSVSVGDGAMNQGAIHEAMVFAVARKLPVIFICENNGWSEMTPTETIVPLPKMGIRASAYPMSSRTVDGNDPQEVKEAVAEGVELARNGDGPSFVECRTIRLWGHYNRDIEHYRPKSDIDAAADADPLPRLQSRLLELGHSETDLNEIRERVKSEIFSMGEQANSSCEPEPVDASTHVYVSSSEVDRVPTETAVPKELAYWKAVNEALQRELEERPELVIFGEDVGHAGGIFGCTRYLQDKFGDKRVFDTPISEAAILGTAVGAAMHGMRPVAEIMWADFSLVALDQLFNQAANVSYITQGRTAVPMVVRMQQGATPGSCAQHSQCLEALMAHIPGLRVGLPGTPQDAYSMLRAAIADPNPVIIIESRAMYQDKAMVDLELVDNSVGGMRIRRSGSSATIISYGSALSACENAAYELSNEGLEFQVVDLRWLNPIDWEELANAVADTDGKALIVHEANLTGGFGAEIASRLWERGATTVSRLGAKDSRIPASPVLQDAILPRVEPIKKALRELV